ncbi:alpha/beta hydrolase [Singulisphaera sp. Ch08]|uniref:Alpha/beta hydrolase n=1 Tax=Singulisphaera sp. Ch08 TaxID=3120278 RepID=A0AAU7CFI5_9BACT
MTRQFLLGLTLIPCLAGAGPAETPAGEPFVYKTAEGRKLRLWVVKPEGWKASDHRPGAVFFHGGGWTGGRPGQFDTQARYLATRGMVCALVEYRLLSKENSEKEATPPVACCQDAKSAMRWVRSHAGELGIDPARIAAGGGSAGGHLAAFTGMVEGQDDPADDASVSARPDALILFNPVIDNGPGGWGIGRVRDRYKEFSPAHNVSKDDPPTIVFLGSKDRLIPVKTLEDFQTNMRKEGVRCEAFVYADQSHGFFNKDPWTTKTLIEADRFLESLGWLSGPPTLKDLKK